MRAGLRDSDPVLNGPAPSCVGRAHVRAVARDRPRVRDIALGAQRANVGAGAALSRDATHSWYRMEGPRC